VITQRVPLMVPMPEIMPPPGTLVLGVGIVHQPAASDDSSSQGARVEQSRQPLARQQLPALVEQTPGAPNLY
jgi:hypothetical protein